MVHRAFCVGLTYPTGEGGSPIPGSDLDAHTMGALAATMGIEDVTVVTDTEAPVTRDQILDGLRDMVAQAQPGDALLFSYAGHGSQRADASDDEADGKNEVLCAADGPITDDEIRAVLAGLPAGATMTLSIDACYSGTMVDLDVDGDEIAGDVVCISAAQDDQVSMGSGAGGAFTNALASVLAENPGISWVDAVQLIDEADHLDTQRPVLTSNRAEALMRPAFTIDPSATAVPLEDDQGFFEEVVDYLSGVFGRGESTEAATDDLSMDMATLEVTDGDLIGAATGDSELLM
ncbi:hypothetical protein H9P43_009536 [Blastocladiella emersonii ATCC 22665]|nr:hypothetical protein H9P43_009536 [Blastocladiella emersonii ATCC 22665]